MKTTFIIFGLILASAAASADMKLVATKEISIREGTVSTAISSSIVMEKVMPDIYLGCSLRHSSTNYNRVIKQGSKFTVKNIGKVISVDLSKASLSYLKAEVETRFAVKLSDQINTRAKLEKHLETIYGAKLVGSVHNLKIDVVSDQTDSPYKIECGSGTKAFTADEAIAAINVSGMFAVDNEM